MYLLRQRVFASPQGFDSQITWNKMKPALCFNSKKLQNIYKLDAITTADSPIILNIKKETANLTKLQKNLPFDVRFAENHQARKNCGKMTVFSSSPLHWEGTGTEIRKEISMWYSPDCKRGFLARSLVKGLTIAMLSFPFFCLAYVYSNNLD